MRGQNRRSKEVCSLVCGLICLLFLFIPAGASGEASPAATLPPGQPAAVGAPQAVLPMRLYAIDAPGAEFRQVALWGDQAAVVGHVKAADGAFTDVLWAVDLTTGTYSRLYEARRGVQIETPVFCQGVLYWSEIYEDQATDWRIRRWNEQKRRVELVRSDAYKRSAIAPMLSTDGTRVYWYESGEQFAKQPPYQRLKVSLFALEKKEKGDSTKRLDRLEIAFDWRPPYVHNGAYAIGVYEEGQWWVRMLIPDTGAIQAQIQTASSPISVQGNGSHLIWGQSSAWAYAEAGEERIARQAQAEETVSSQATEEAAALWMAAVTGPDAAPQRVDSRVEAALLRDEGVYYINDAQVLCLHSFALGRVLRLTPHADYLPTLSVQGDALLTLRAIDEGDGLRYRLAAIDIRALQTGEWPPLQ